jgi:hypothetical protein
MSGDRNSRTGSKADVTARWHLTRVARIDATLDCFRESDYS